MRKKVIPGFSLYRVTASGRVFNERREMNPHENHNGYLMVKLRRDDGAPKNVMVHRLVLMAFVGLPTVKKPNGLHKDGDPKNNHIKNLYWGCQKDNMVDRRKHGRMAGLKGTLNHRSVLTEKDVLCIRREKKPHISLRMLAEKYGVSVSTIHKIVRGRTWNHLKSIAPWQP